MPKHCSTEVLGHSIHSMIIQQSSASAFSFHHTMNKHYRGAKVEAQISVLQDQSAPLNVAKGLKDGQQSNILPSRAFHW